MHKQFRDAAGNVLHAQTTQSGEVALRTPGEPVRLTPEEIEELRQFLADARAELLRGTRWQS